MASVLIVDDHPMVRTGLKNILVAEQYSVCGEASGVEEAILAVRSTSPDIVLIDIQLKDGSGIDLIRELRKSQSGVKMLAVSMHDEMIYAERALRAGAHGYIEKDQSPANLISAIQKVLSGKHYISEAVNERILARAAGSDDGSLGSRIHLLSDREFEAFELISEGLTAKEIAEKLGVAVKTVNTFRENIKAKLQLESANRLMRVAMEWKLTGDLV